jgi:hypothetical protein
MIIWRGYGLLVVFITLGCVVAAEVIATNQFGPNYTRQHHWPLAAGVAAAGVASWLIGARLNGGGTGDESGGYRNVHHLYFIPMQWWGPLLITISFAILLVGSGSPPQADAADAPQHREPIIVRRR